MEELNLLAGFPGFIIQKETYLFIVQTGSVTTNVILKMIHINQISSPRSRSPQLLASGDTSSPDCRPTPVAGSQTFSHLHTHVLSRTLWIPPVTGLRLVICPVASLRFPALQLHTDMHIGLSGDLPDLQCPQHLPWTS